MSQTSKERLAIANSAQPKLGPHRVRPAHLLSSSLQGLLLAEKWDWRITPGGTAFLWHLKAFAHEGQKHSWCGRVSALQIASHLQTRSVCCGSITPTQLALTACVITPLRGRMCCHSATDLRREWQKACGSTHLTLWHSQNLRDSCELGTSSAHEWKTGSPLNRMDGPKFRVLKQGDLNGTNNLPLSCHEKSEAESRSPRQ